MDSYPATPESDNDDCSLRSSGESSVKEQERFLPIANVSRIMKKALPGNAKISKDAKEAVQECVSEFISFITGEASDKCLREKRKTINGEDLLWGMAILGFEDYIEPLKCYLNRFREAEGSTTPVSTTIAGNGKVSTESAPYNISDLLVNGGLASQLLQQHYTHWRQMSQ